MLKRIAQVMVLAIVLGAAPLVALRGVSYASGSLSWTGQGADSVTACSPGQTPFLHWIFTTGGNSEVTAATLTVSGDASGSGAMSEHGGSWTLDTAYSGTNKPTTSSVTASVAYTGSLGKGNPNLVISDGCYGSNGGGERTDVCKNIEGIQTEVPAGMQVDSQGNCTTPNNGGQGGQVLGSNTTASVAVTPAGGVNAGAGGALGFGSL